MNSNAARAQFGAVSERGRSLFERIERRTSSEASSSFETSSSTMPVNGCLRADDALVGRAPFEQGKARNPHELPTGPWESVSIGRRAVGALGRNQRGSIRAGDLFLAVTATTRSPGLAPAAAAIFFSASAPRFFSSGDVTPSGVTLNV